MRNIKKFKTPLVNIPFIPSFSYPESCGYEEVLEDIKKDPSFENYRVREIFGSHLVMSDGYLCEVGYKIVMERVNESRTI